MSHVDGGPTQVADATWLRNDASKKAQYFKARLPAFRADQTVEYLAVCRCAGREVPRAEDSKSFGSSFHVRGQELPKSGSGSPSNVVASKQELQSRTERAGGRAQ